MVSIREYGKALETKGKQTHSVDLLAEPAAHLSHDDSTQSKLSKYPAEP
jgi:hypothetical protein